MRRKKTIWKRLAFATLLAGALGSICLLAYGLYLSDQIGKRFSGRRWSVPSKVYSDTTLLYPGQSINRSLLAAKLDHLGYRRVPDKPKQRGELRVSETSLEIFLNDLKAPHLNRPGFPVKIVLHRNRIESMAHMDTLESISLLELEPEELMFFFGPEREQRRLVALNQVPQPVINAIVASEDAHFYEHHGFYTGAILRALWANVRHGEIKQGGSTITQQLAKNYFLTPERTITRKVKELIMALIMEWMYQKKEILEIYLNEIYLGQKGSVSVNGIGEASFFYFNKPVSELTLVEGAMIAGLIRAPNLYSPYVDMKRCRERRDWVLKKMQKDGWISDEQLQASLAKAVETSGFEAFVRKAPYFIDYLAQQLTTLYSEEALRSLGLSLFTTLDTQVQMAAEKALERGLMRLEKSRPTLRRSDPEKKLQGAILVMQPKTGYILAMVGGRNYHESQYNRVTQAKRQPGSAFKPFVFLSGLDKFTPVSWLSNEPKSYMVNGKAWQPDNYETLSEKRVTMRMALAKSINVATVDLAMQVGMDQVVTTASAFGFSTPFKPYPSLALGALEMIPLEMAQAYCAFAADGVLPQALSLKEILDDHGQVVERRHAAIKAVTTPAKAFLITSMLQSAVEEGTARSLKETGITFTVAGKTGTSNDLKDAWFVGYTPDILAMVWVGFDNGDSIHASGAAAALPIWADLIKEIPHHVSGEWFKTPSGIEPRMICSESGQLAVTGRCPYPREEMFLSETVPRELCAIHRGLDPIEKFIQGVKDFFKNF